MSTADTASPSRFARIRELNDILRRTFMGGKVMITSGVAALDNEMKTKVLTAVCEFKDFDEGNDPHNEHDFGAVEVEGIRIFFKHDYYDLDMRYLSDDPSDPTITERVMTIMLAEEY